MIISIIAYFVFGFLFMTACAKFGWMGRYDPAIFYWIFWPVIMATWMFKLVVYIIDMIQTPVERYVANLKPNTEDNNKW